jgi:cobalt-zinc-cadmium efflux system outer membrane protein
MNGWVTSRSLGCFAAFVMTSVSGCAINHYHHLGDGKSDAAMAVRSVPGTLVPVPGLSKTVVSTDAPQQSGTKRQKPTRSTDVLAVAHCDDAVDQQRDDAQGDPLPTPRKLTQAESKLESGLAKLTLDQVINATLLADPKLRAGFEAINQANGDALTASLKPNPTFNINQTLLPLTRPFTVDAQGGPPQLDIGLAYPIDWFLFGKRAAAMQAALLGVRISESEFADLVRQRVLQAATAYYDVLAAKALRDLARQDVDNLKQVESITQKSVTAGNRPAVELNRVRLDRLQSEQTLRDAEKTLVNAKAQLRVLLGRSDADSEFDVAGTLDELPQLEPLPAEEAYATALQNRPDLAALRWKVSQAQASTVVERRNAYPELTPQIGYTRQFQQKAIGFPDASSFGFGFDMTLPLFNRNQGNRFKAASVLAQSQLELRAGEVELRAEVTQADQNLRTAAANAKAVAGEQLKIAGEVRDTINQSYALGNRPLIDVLDAQRNYRETYRLYITSRAELGRAVVNYSATLGKKVTP